MWSSNGGHDECQHWTREQHQWSTQQSNYCQSVPHESVDWALLAKQWIQMQSQTQSLPQMPPMSAPLVQMSAMTTMTTIGSPMPPHLPPMPSPFVIHRPQHISEDIARPVYQTPIEANNWNRGRPPGPPPPSLRPPMPPIQRPMPPIPPPLLPNPPMTAVNYQSSFGWRPPTVPSLPLPVMPSNDVNKQTIADKMTVNQAMSLDAAKKKNLPNWLREGLDKMERERAKKVEKEKEEHERRERYRAIKDKEDQLRREIELESKLSSIYESDNNEDIEDKESNDAHNSDDESVGITEEEMMLRVRKRLTEILLEVTNDEIETIAADVLNRAKNRVPAVRHTSGATSIKRSAKLGGLTVLSGYGSESDGSEDQMDNKSAQNPNESKTEQTINTNVDKDSDFHSNNKRKTSESRDRKNDEKSRRNSDSERNRYKRSESNRSLDRDRKRSRDQRSRSRNRSKSKERRSRSRERNQSRDRRPNREKDVERSRSNERNSRSNPNRRSRNSRSRSKGLRTRSRSRSRDRRRSRNRSNSRSRSGSKDRKYRRTSSREERRKYNK